MRNKNSFNLKNISDSDILSNLNITLSNNVVREMVFLWNKYQIYFFDLHNTEMVAHELFFSFDILDQLLPAHEYLICRDQSGIVWKCITYNSFLTDNFTHVFDKIDNNIISLTHSENGNLLLSLKQISNTFDLFIYNSDYSKLLNSFEIKYNDIIYDKCKMYCHTMQEKHVVITSNGVTLHYFIVDIHDISDCIVAKKLINCPSEINDIHFTNQNILISLNIGTIIKIDLNTLEHSIPETRIIHLNTAIHKILTVNDFLIYTDGQTMWRADNIFSKDIQFRQFFVKLVKDFVYIDTQNEIICTTYIKNLYRFSLDDETAYISPVSTKEYCTAKQLFDDMSYMDNIISEIEENDEMIKKIKMEENFITTIALANRQDIVNDIIHIDMAIHEKYEDIIKDYNLLTLTDDIKDYYAVDSYCLIIKLTVRPIHPKFTDILSDLFGKLEIHITILSDNKVLKTVTLKVIKQLKNMNIVVPLIYLKNTKLTVCMKLVTNIPGALDRKQTLWVTLHTSETVLSSEHFIKTMLPSSNICHLKKTLETMDNLICEYTSKQYGNIFKFIKNKTISMKWQFYVKLPNHYKELFGNKEFYKHLNSKQAQLLTSVMSADNFLKSGNSISLNVANEKVQIDIDIGFSNAVLKIAGVNFQVASDIRDFISNLLHEENINNSKEFVSNSILKTLEDLEQDIKAPPEKSIENIHDIHERFQKNVIIALNI